MFKFFCPKFALTYVEFALTSSRYCYGINPIVGIRLNVEYMLVIIIIIIIIIIIPIIIIKIIIIKIITIIITKNKSITTFIVVTNSTFF